MLLWAHKFVVFAEINEGKNVSSVDCESYVIFGVVINNIKDIWV